MDIGTVTRTIQLIIAPVVLITACSIILGGLNARYGAISDRLRAMSRERLELLRSSGGGKLAIGPSADAYTLERLDEIDRQVPDLVRRHKLVRDALLAVAYAIATFVATMLVIALAVATGSTWIAIAVLLIFLAGTGSLLAGIALMVVEIRASHRAVQYEVTRVQSLGK